MIFSAPCPSDAGPGLCGRTEVVSKKKAGKCANIPRPKRSEKAISTDSGFRILFEGRSRNQKENNAMKQQREQDQAKTTNTGANDLLDADWIKNQDPHLQAQLVRIWETAQHLQRQIGQPVPVEGYRQDALEQIERVEELISEYKADPDGARLALLRLSLAVAVDRIDTYQQVAGAVVEGV